MKGIVKMSMQSIRKKLNADDRTFCFEIYGYDFIIDEDFKTWLIEVNTNPCLDESSALLRMLLPRMIGIYVENHRRCFKIDSRSNISSKTQE